MHIIDILRLQVDANILVISKLGTAEKSSEEDTRVSSIFSKVIIKGLVNYSYISTCNSCKFLPIFLELVTSYPILSKLEREFFYFNLCILLLK